MAAILVYMACEDPERTSNEKATDLPVNSRTGGKNDLARAKKIEQKRRNVILGLPYKNKKGACDANPFFIGILK
ncbi:MAG: hypothetical protein H7325_10170 [Pedobacter sp.]|nr:hypothetical protein [Pedobacter sp.]